MAREKGLVTKENVHREEEPEAAKVWGAIAYAAEPVHKGASVTRPSSTKKLVQAHRVISRPGIDLCASRRLQLHSWIREKTMSVGRKERGKNTVLCTNQEIRNWTSRRGIAEFRGPVELKGRVVNSIPVLTCNITVGGASGGATIVLQKGATRVGKAEEACDAWQVGTNEELGCTGKNENTEKCHSGKPKVVAQTGTEPQR
ncbi:hypothetical protein B0H14DRAFT_2654114 [Mycena olivaceomarginata]|nr:hypothetical protein B0H14DRAFT_2654114 [Mycena olivaceomarginata]